MTVTLWPMVFSGGERLRRRRFAVGLAISVGGFAATALVAPLYSEQHRPGTVDVPGAIVFLVFYVGLLFTPATTAVSLLRRVRLYRAGLGVLLASSVAASYWSNKTDDLGAGLYLLMIPLAAFLVAAALLFTETGDHSRSSVFD